MKPYMFWHWDRLPTLREADGLIASIAGRGFGIIILPETDFLTPAFFEALRASCRSAARYGAELIVGDDNDIFSGVGGGEVTSVPEFRARLLTVADADALDEGETPLAKSGEKCVVVRRGDKSGPADVFEPKTAAAFAGCVYRRIIRETPRFIGHELAGIYTAPPFPPGFLPYSEELMEAALREGMSVESIVFGADGERYRSLANAMGAATLHPELQSRCREAGLRLISSVDSPLAESISVLKSSAIGNSFYAGMTAELLAFPSLRAAVDGEAVENRALPFCHERRRFDFDKIWAEGAERLQALADGMTEASAAALTDESGGIKIIRLKRPDAALFIFFNTGTEAAHCRCNIPDPRPALICSVFGGNDFPTEHEFDAEIEPGGFIAVLCAETASSAAEPVSFVNTGAFVGERGEARTLTAELVEEGESSAAYEVRIPELPKSGGILQLNGSFACAEVRIGRHRAKVILPPFAIALGADDAGRAAEITLYSDQPEDGNGKSAGEPLIRLDYVNII